MDYHRIPMFIYLFLREVENRNYMRIKRKELRDTQNPFDIPNYNFIKLYRLNKDTVLRLVDLLQIHANPSVRSTAIPFFLKLLATLHFIGQGSYQLSIGSNAFHQMSQTSISRCIHEICLLITRILMPEWVKFPTTLEQKSSAKLGFYEKFRMRAIIGAIDGTHVQIVAPPVTDIDHPPHVYINRRGKYTINVMLICDSNCRILACNARYPGSVHDSAVWRMSDIRQNVRTQYENGDHNTYLIGDSAYVLEPWLLVPIGQVIRGTPEANYNRLLTSARNTIERTNGILKTRFRSILHHRVLHYRPSKAAYIIYAACVLHNIALSENLHIPENEIIYDDRNDDIDIEEHIDYNNMAGRQARQRYIQQIM